MLVVLNATILDADSVLLTSFIDNWACQQKKNDDMHTHTYTNVH